MFNECLPWLALYGGLIVGAVLRDRWCGITDKEDHIERQAAYIVTLERRLEECCGVLDQTPPS